MRKRRKTRYQWLLNTGTVGPAADAQADASGREFVVSSATNGSPTVAIVDLLEDTPSDDTTLSLPMGVYQNNDYFIKRIVGKLFVAIDGGQTSGISDNVLVTAGIFVARAGDADDSAGAENLPIGGDVAAERAHNYDPNRVECIREPWMWRRQWIIRRPDVTTVLAYPTSTAFYGSVADGPHIDCKTARRVKNDERLWAALSVRNYPINSTTGTATQVRAWLDYRVLGQMRRAKQGGAF